MLQSFKSLLKQKLEDNKVDISVDGVFNSMEAFIGLSTKSARIAGIRGNKRNQLYEDLITILTDEKETGTPLSKGLKIRELASQCEILKNKIQDIETEMLIGLMGQSASYPGSCALLSNFKHDAPIWVRNAWKEPYLRSLRLWYSFRYDVASTLLERSDPKHIIRYMGDKDIKMEPSPACKKRVEYLTEQYKKKQLSETEALEYWDLLAEAKTNTLHEKGKNLLDHLKRNRLEDRPDNFSLLNETEDTECFGEAQKVVPGGFDHNETLNTRTPREKKCERCDTLIDNLSINPLCIKCTEEDTGWIKKAFGSAQFTDAEMLEMLIRNSPNCCTINPHIYNKVHFTKEEKEAKAYAFRDKVSADIETLVEAVRIDPSRESMDRLKETLAKQKQEVVIEEHCTCTLEQIILATMKEPPVKSNIDCINDADPYEDKIPTDKTERELYYAEKLKELKERPLLDLGMVLDPNNATLNNVKSKKILAKEAREAKKKAQQEQARAAEEEKHRQWEKDHPGRSWKLEEADAYDHPGLFGNKEDY